MILKRFLIWAIFQEKDMLIDLAKMAKSHTFGLANSLLDSPMATWLTLTGTLHDKLFQTRSIHYITTNTEMNSILQQCLHINGSEIY